MARRRALYHGTSLHRWQMIAANGYVTGLIYLADSPSGTEMYRANAVFGDERDGIPEETNAEVVIRLDLEVLMHSGRLMPDWDDVSTNLELFPGAVSAEDVSWMESLKRLHTCSYQGPLQAAVTAVRVLE